MPYSYKDILRFQKHMLKAGKGLDNNYSIFLGGFSSLLDTGAFMVYYSRCGLTDDVVITNMFTLKDTFKFRRYKVVS